MLKHDHGATFILVWCVRCDGWSTPRTTKMAAHLAAALHEKQVHPELDRARDAAWQYAKQHADELAPFRSSTEYAAIISSWEFSTAGASRVGSPRRRTPPSAPQL